MSYLGNTPVTQSFISGTDYFNGTGSQTVFTLTRSVASINDIQVTVNNVVQQPNSGYTVSNTTLTFDQAPSAGTNNVYVRYLSTTTQAITPSQNTVSWNTLDTNTQQDLGISFKNRIINSNMVIDQRNNGASGTAIGYTVDRFAYFGSQTLKGTWQQNAGSVTPPTGFRNYLGFTSSSAYTVGSGEEFELYQSIEGFNTADLAWGTANAAPVTLSFWVRSSLTGTFGGSFQNSNGSRSYPYSYTISAANTWEYKTVTVAGDTTGTWNTTNGIGIAVYFGLGVGSTKSGTAGSWSGSYFTSATGATSVVGTNGATFYLTGVQLEVGTQATTFTTAGGSYGAELALCQRYYWQRNSETQYAGIGAGTVVATNQVRINFSYPVRMRAAPSVSVTNIGNTIITQGGDITPSGITPYANSTGAMADILVAGGVVGRGAVWLFDAVTSSSVQASAEL
jgi:hypothetical protein